MKWAKRILFGILLTGLSLLGLSIYTVFTHLDDKFDGQAECAVVFGAAVWRDDIPSQALYDRMMGGIELYKDGHVQCLILSGGASSIGAHEVDVMKKMAIEADIPEGHLVLDYRGKNTEATIQNLPNGVKSFVMVSNDFHLARIGFIAKKMHIKNVSLHAADYHEGQYNKRNYYFFREILGLILYFLFSFFLF